MSYDSFLDLLERQAELDIEYYCSSLSIDPARVIEGVMETRVIIASFAQRLNEVETELQCLRRQTPS